MRQIKIFAGQGRRDQVAALLDQCLLPGSPGVSKHQTIDTGRRQFDIRIEESVRGCQVFFVLSHTDSCNDDLEEACQMVRALLESGAAEVTVVAPHLPYGRRDHVDAGRTSNGAKHVLQQLKHAGACRVITGQLRTDQIQAYFDGSLVHCKTSRLFADHLQQKYGETGGISHVLVAPELGKSTYAARIRNHLANWPVAVFDAGPDGMFSLLQDAYRTDPPKTALIVDHEVTSGKTAAARCEFLKQHGFVQVELIVHHAVLLPGALTVLYDAGIDHLVTTDTIPHHNMPDWVTVLPVIPAMIKTINRIVTGRRAGDLWE